MKKNLLVILLSILLVLSTGTSPIYADSISDDSISANEDTLYTRNVYAELFAKNGISVAEDAYLGTTEVTDETGYSYDVAAMVTIDGNCVTKSVLLESYIDTNGISHLIDLHTSVRIQTGNGSDAELSAIMSGTLSNVYASAYFYYSTGSGGNTIYRPYKCTAVSYTSQNIYVNYFTQGNKHNTSGTMLGTTGSHSITCSAYPATANYEYSTTNTASYYYGMGGNAGLSFHRIYVTANGGSQVYFKVTADSE